MAIGKLRCRRALRIESSRTYRSVAGSGQIVHKDTPYAVGKGDIWLLPAEAGECAFQPSGEVTLLEIAIP